MNSPVSQKTLNVSADYPDLRDRYYQPNLTPLKPFIDPPGNLVILDQGKDGACTGFALAATINFIYRQQGRKQTVSPWMLYAMAKRHDEWLGEAYEGSSCRGAIKGWYNSGVCHASLTEDITHSNEFEMSLAIANNASNHRLGAYYRIEREISDFHAALNEVGVIFVSARIHEGWNNCEGDTITLRPEPMGGHAFAIVGYNDEGFWIQNSWGADWKKSGLALWRYDDWALNVMDAWVVQLALPIAGTGTFHQATRSIAQGLFSRSTPRVSIQDHFVHFDDGHFDTTSKYWSNKNHVDTIIEKLSQSEHKHVMLYAHGGLNSIKASAKRIAAMKDTFLKNEVYPIHFMYDTGMLEELKDILGFKNQELSNKVGAFTDYTDRILEWATRKVGSALWREMKSDACTPFTRVTSDGTYFLTRLADYLKNSTHIQLHIVGHSAGSIFQAHSLARLFKIDETLKVDSLHLMAPAISYPLFNETLAPLIESEHIASTTVYNLSGPLEKNDHVARIYQKSLLYLVSNAFESKTAMPLLGMAAFNAPIANVTFKYSEGKEGDSTAATSHGGFDSDVDTMNSVLTDITGGSPKYPFTKAILDY
ncbi:C1 family peptidase [Alteromonas mediterranea]|uniref:C1 family peptidase n=1 Tax=Alteromonas mediterranea TaxID=314275 RepID=UPI002FDF11F3